MANSVSVIVQVGDKILTKQELEENLSSRFLTEDSTLAAEHYIRMWITDNLLYDVANKNIADQDKIDQLVDNYRRSLVIYQYQEQLINEKLSSEMNDEVLLEFFETNRDKFQMDRPLIQGFFLKVPIDAPHIDKIKTLYKPNFPSSIDDVEKYSVQNAVSYDYFIDHWIDFYEWMDNWPVNYRNELDVLKRRSFLEQRDEHFYYFLYIHDFLLPGDNAPFEYAQPVIREIIINQKKMEFLRGIEENLYNKALNNGQIKFYEE
jgi:hypothetical protein